ncbi:hypothetical protein GCM10010123_15820 [Pilimelia anulata]|uniref:Serine protease n=1 Tax=Pilimelia anulata TaxID=53371 RepID=A0A8J3FBT9_9ACTN|nr:trypsin-like peptidase domain-containing protein [Pilimelia anulata]GGJ87057.1 hypothetical protein GCM10010123_15820 [Pilimelia anulata]
MRGTRPIPLLAALAAAVLTAQPALAAEPPPRPIASGSGAPLYAEPAPTTPSGVLLDRAIDVRYGAAPTVLRFPGATYVKIHLAALRLAPGDRLTVADPAGREVHTYRVDPTLAAAPAADSGYTRHRTRGFAPMSVDGDTAVVTIHRDGSGRVSGRALDRAGYGAHIDLVRRGYDEAEYARANPSAVCGKDARRDVVCYKERHPTEYARSRAVARMLKGNSGWCTAWRVGNTNRLFTNNHYLGKASELQGMEIQFEYDCATCGGNNPGAGVKVAGGDLIKTNASLDYSLFTVQNFDKITGFGTLYLDVRAPSNGEQIYIPGHGDTKPKRLSIYEEDDSSPRCTVRSTQGNRTAYNCDTSGGNSGSPVLAVSSHKVISLHNTGSCPNNNGSNRIDRIWSEVSSQIDNNG